jgi:branched-chain amino acid transport system substrate-binding protein
VGRTGRLLAGAAIAGAAATAASGATQIVPLPASSCSAIVPATTQPQLLIASDFPIRSTFTPVRDTTSRMQAAIRFVLARHGYRAGRFRVAFQACDDSTPQSPSGDLARCAANAKADAANGAVIGVIGTWDSRCAAVEIPILDVAPNGPLALVSPSNTNVGLTHASAGTDPGEPDRYYPARVRNFVRLNSPDDAQGRAEALLAARLRVRRIFLLDDGSGFGLDVAQAFRESAGDLGVSLVGTERWNPAHKRFDDLRAKVRASGATGVFLAGFGCPTCGELIRALRAAVGRAGTIIASDGFDPGVETARQAGSAAEGMYVGSAGTTLARLSPLGREIARRFGPYRLGSGGAAYAAEAAEVLLDAIARSDGTRASVTRALFATHIRNGILGSFSFDANGDSTLNPVLIFRIAHGKGVLDRVLVAP